LNTILESSRVSGSIIALNVTELGEMVEVGLLSGKLVINATEKKIYLRNVSH
jgi:hypothetical protein